MINIMVIDDSPETLNVVKHIIETEVPFESSVTLYSDSSLAKAEFLALKPDLVITDITMPEINGYDLIEYMKVHLEVPIIAISGSTFNDNDTSTILFCAEKVGADFCLLKDEMVAKLASFVEVIFTTELLGETHFKAS